MISKDTIKRTAACRWSDEDDCFIVESPLFDRVIGTGDSETEAQALFASMLDDAYADLKAGNVIGYNKVGRPSKEGVQLNCKVKQQTHNGIARLAQKLEISQGEVVDVLAFHYCNRPAAAALTSEVALAVREVLAEYGFRTAGDGGRRAVAAAGRTADRGALTKTTQLSKRNTKKKTRSR